MLRCRSAASASLAALVLCVTTAPRAARADETTARPTLAGAWSASPLTESWTVTEWGDPCGPRPTPEGAAGGAVQIREQGGELVIAGAGRTFSTAECWEQMPGVARSSHSQAGDGRAWRTRCASAPGDSRRTAVTTSLTATDASIVMIETGDYAFAIRGATCHATVARARSFALVRRDGDLTPAPAATPSHPSARCPGSARIAARLEVQPARKLLRAGDRLAFRSAVVDEEGCPTSARPEWSLEDGPVAARATIGASGELVVSDDAPEGVLAVKAQVHGASVTVHVDVVSPEHYDAMLATSAEGGASAGDRSEVAVIANGTVGGRTGRAEDGSRERRATLVALVVALAVGLAFIGLVLVRRGARAHDDEEDEEPEGLDEELAGDPSPASRPSRPAPVSTPRRPKICPTCGERYPSDASFCGEDSTALVLLN